MAELNEAPKPTTDAVTIDQVMSGEVLENPATVVLFGGPPKPEAHPMVPSGEPEPTPPTEDPSLPAFSNRGTEGQPAPTQIWQVKTVGNRLFGLIFTVGDANATHLHGYTILPGGKMEYTTALIRDCIYVGEAHVKSRQACSPEWKRKPMAVSKTEAMSAED